MAEEDVKTVSVEQFNELKDKLESQEKAYSELKQNHDKLTKIFDERQTKSLDKVLKDLGFEKKDPEKSDKEIITGKFKELENLISEQKAQLSTLQNEIAEKDKRIILNDKKAKVRELANGYNFIDVSDVLNAVDYSNDDLEGQVKSLAENKKHWIAPKNVGNNFQSFQDGKKEEDDFIKGFDNAFGKD